MGFCPIKWKCGISEPSTVLLITLTNFYTLLGTHISIQKLHLLKMIVLFPKVGYVFIPLEGRYFALPRSRRSCWRKAREECPRLPRGILFCYKKTPSNQRENGQPWVLQTEIYMYPHWVQDTSTHLYPQDSKYTPSFTAGSNEVRVKIEFFALQVHVVIHQLWQFWTNSFSGVDYSHGISKIDTLEDGILSFCDAHLFAGQKNGATFPSEVGGVGERSKWQRSCVCHYFFGWIPGKNYDSWDETWPIGSMGLVYLPTFTIKINQM